MTDTELSSSRQPGRRAREAQRAIQGIARVAGLGLGLGLLMQGLIILLRLFGAGHVPDAMALADLAQTVTWSVLVCSSVAVGMAIGKARTALAPLVGAIFAPLALAAAKAVHRVMLSVLELADQPAALSLATISVLRAVEYGLLAWLLTLLAERSERRMAPYALAGTGVALVFGGAVLVLTVMAQDRAGTSLDTLALASLGLREIGTPIGCALVIYIAQMLATNARLWARGGTQPPPRRRRRRA